MFHKIKHLSTKILSHFCVVCFGKAGFCKHCHVNRLDLLKRVTKSNFLKQGLRLCVGENTCEEIAVFVVCGNRFFVGNSQLNCRIIESIVDMSLVYLREQRTNFDELRLHYFCTILYGVDNQLTFACNWYGSVVFP